MGSVRSGGGSHSACKANGTSRRAFLPRLARSCEVDIWLLFFVPGARRSTKEDVTLTAASGLTRRPFAPCFTFGAPDFRVLGFRLRS